MGTLEQLLFQMNKRCPSSIDSISPLCIALGDFGFASSYQAYRDKLHANIRIPMETNISFNGSSSAAPSVRDIDPDRHCSCGSLWRGVSIIK